jgi:ribosomal protein S18 acetylase RimI-like enzyme
MYSLRKATLDDVEKLIDFRIRFLKEIQDLPTDKEMLIFKNTLREFFLEKMGTGDFIAWLAEINHKIIATSSLSFLTKPPHFNNITGKFAYIMNMYTDPEWRRKGIGADLLEKLIEEIKKRRIKLIVLHATQAGRSLYERYGFRENNDDKEMILKL